MLHAPLARISLVIATLAAPAAGQTLIGDGSADGVRLIVCSEQVGEAGLFEPITERYSLFSLGDDLMPVDSKILEELLPHGAISSEYDLQVAGLGGGFILNVVNPKDIQRQLMLGQVTDGKIEFGEVLAKNFDRKDFRQFVLPNISRTGRHVSWFVKSKATEKVDDRYELHIRYADAAGEAQTRTLNPLVPMAAFSPDETEIAYIEPVEDRIQNPHYRLGRLVREPVGGGEKKLLSYGYFLIDSSRPHLHYSADGESLYVVAESMYAEPKRSVQMQYGRTPKPKLYRVAADGTFERLFRNKTVMWLEPSPLNTYIYAFSYQIRIDGQARMYESNTGKQVLKDGTDEILEIRQIPWAGSSHRPMPVWVSDDRFIVQDASAFLFEQTVGKPSTDLKNEAGGRLLRYLRTPSLFEDEKRLSAEKTAKATKTEKKE